MFIKIAHLSIDLKDFQLRDVNLDIEKGDYVVIIGPTGSGKSVILETIAGFYTPETGKIILEGQDITYFPPEKRNMSIVYQDYMLFPHMTIYENIAYGLKKTFDKGCIEKEVKHIARLLKIEHLLHRFPGTLSGGEAQRTAIARALVVKPRLLLMDEPFSALDVKTKKELRQLVKTALKEYQTTTVHVTHDLDDVWHLATKVVIMRQGKVLQVGPPEHIFANPTDNFVADFMGANTFKGKIIGEENGLSLLKLAEGIKLYSKDQGPIGQEAIVAIRPEHILISPKSSFSHVSNVFCGRIINTKVQGHLVWLTLDIEGLYLKALLTPNAYELMGLNERGRVFVTIKSSNVKIISLDCKGQG